MKDIRLSKKFEIAKEDDHRTYLIVYDDGSFTIGELFGEEPQYQYHAMLSVRQYSAKEIISILSRYDTWQFPKVYKMDEEME